MIYSVLRAVVTNNLNDNEIVTWFLAKTESDDYDFRDDQHEAVRRWNQGGPGFMSMRYLSTDIFYPDEFENLTMDHLKGIPLPMLKKVLDHIPTTDEGTTS